MNHEKYITVKNFNKLPFKISKITRHKKNKLQYYDLPCAFDIETTSYYIEDALGEKEPRAFMYIWQVCIGDPDREHIVIIGRTWTEFLEFIEKIKKMFHLALGRVLVFYVHNLAYEMSFIRCLFEWSKVFALKERVPLYTRSVDGIEFRCSYRLSGYSLQKVAEQLHSHNPDIKKLTLDYSLIRHSKTKITPDEMDYNIMDVKIVCAYIAECLEDEGGNITKIPLTKTGYVRRECRQACFGVDHTAKKYQKYYRKMQQLTIEPLEYQYLKAAFSGGFTHANSWHVGKVLYNVESQDFTSSYPYVAFSEMFPWSKGEVVYPTLKELVDNIDTYAWIIEIEMWKIESICLQEDFIQKLKCIDSIDLTINNGRINRAGYVHMVITSLDFKIIMQTYRINGDIKIGRCYRYMYSYLPTDFVKCMLSFYNGKTTLKGVAGKEVEYLHLKENLNSFYGMMVTDPLRDEIIYTKENEWDSIRRLKGGKWSDDDIKLLNKYNKSATRFIFYPVGVWITAYARYNLWSAIMALGADYVYSDTDSVKFLNPQDHRSYFNDYNNKVIEKLQKACSYHGIDFSEVAPKTIDGDTKILGMWDFDGSYKRFKTLGSKRYMVEDQSGNISLTVAGLNKKTAVPYMLDQFGYDGIFDAFKTDNEFMGDGLYIPPEYSGRTLATYIDHPTHGSLIDYQGHRGLYSELSSVHLAESEYTMNDTKTFVDFLLGRRILDE